jgi:L,D-transpeptidase YnhG
LRAGHAEAKLIEAYRLVGQGRAREALRVVDALLAEYPNFRLALLLQGDLLAALTRPVQRFADVPESMLALRTKELDAFQQEALARLRALREPAPTDMVPREFVKLSTATRHAIAVDASRSRLYLFEHNQRGLKLIANYYVSLGLAGIAKRAEGDQRTPLGVYYITSNLDAKSLGDLYGTGALPINYPNELDKQRGRTGSGIWLHGMPSDTFARPVNATDGCVALANPDLDKLLATVAVASTPVLISPRIEWVKPEALVKPRTDFDQTLDAWRQARMSGDQNLLSLFYAKGFRTGGKDRGQFAGSSLSADAKPRKSKRADKSPPIDGEFSIKEASYLSWVDQQPHMIVTFAEVAKGARTGVIRRQYWQRDPSAPHGWIIYFEGIIG